MPRAMRRAYGVPTAPVDPPTVLPIETPAQVDVEPKPSIDHLIAAEPMSFMDAMNKGAVSSKELAESIRTLMTGISSPF